VPASFGEKSNERAVESAGLKIAAITGIGARAASGAASLLPGPS
jgi:hypothetical protein